MQVTELRIGNTVMWKDIDAPPFQFHYSTFFLDEVEKGNIVGVPVTPEVLEKCGFEKYMDYKWFDDNGFFEIENDAEGFKTVIESASGSHTIIRIRSIHQLQNLYFALTGQELTV